MKEKKPKTVRQESKEEIAALKDQMIRLAADFDNYRKRSQKEKEDFGKFLNSDLLLRMLPILDNLNLAFNHQPKELESNEWVHGIWHIARQLEQVLADEGVVEIATCGHKFDPSLHDAVELVPDKRPEGEIIEEIQKGYKLGERVLRHAKVKVSSGDSK